MPLLYLNLMQFLLFPSLSLSLHFLPISLLFFKTLLLQQQQPRYKHQLYTEYLAKEWLLLTAEKKRKKKQCGLKNLKTTTTTTLIDANKKKKKENLFLLIPTTLGNHTIDRHQLLKLVQNPVNNTVALLTEHVYVCVQRERERVSVLVCLYVQSVCYCMAFIKVAWQVLFYNILLLLLLLLSLLLMYLCVWK